MKRALARWLPPALERTTFVIATVSCLAALLALWQPVPGWVWRVDGPPAAVLWTAYVAGWLLALVSTFLVDHLEFTGLRQAGWGSPTRSLGPTPFISGGLYGVVRHPMMVGLLIAFWCTPRMSLGHLLFAAAASGYIAVGIRFEERDLRRDLGRTYADYAEHVPALVPGWRRTGVALFTTLKSTTGPRAVHTLSKDPGLERATVEPSPETRRLP